ncbi:hypothetical protein [Nocardia sp. NPDC051832]|uniref:hypothetical protein n=1 Tax=Nocardia sp. NPDC051832 TaxID=3155673 RepID=UPI00344768A9
MRFHLIEPEVAGGHGPGTVYDWSTVPATVTKLEYEFADWLGDALLESTPCFVVTAEVAGQIARMGLSGATFDDVIVSISPEGEELMDAELPAWRWLKPTGKPGESDFGVNDALSLVVSDRALAVLADAGIRNADVTEWRA